MRARVVQAKPEGQTWNRKLFDDLRGVPSDPKAKWADNTEERPAGTEEEVMRMPVPRQPIPVA